MISGDGYPRVGWNEFGQFCRATSILDSTLPTSTVDRMFIATKVGSPDVPGSGNTLFRHEFLEILVRISNAKYKETGRVSTNHQALNFIIDSIIDNFEARPWQEFRDEELWTKKVDAIYKANAVQLKLVHAQTFPKHGGTNERVALNNCI